MIVEQEPGFWKGEKLLFEDKGRATNAGKSHKYTVRDDKGHLYGYVRWYAFQYVFSAIVSIMDKFQLRDIADFCEFRTKVQKAKSEERKAIYRTKRHIPGPMPNSLKARLGILEK